MQAATFAGAGAQVYTGTIASTLQAATSSLAGLMDPSGAIISIMQAATSSAAGETPYSGTMAASMLPVTAVFVGYMLPSGAIIAVLQPALFSGTAQQVRVIELVTHQRPRIYIHDGANLHRIGQLTAVTDLNRSYALREHVRTASFSIALTDAALQYTDPRDAHVIWIESSEYPLPWVGRIVEREGNRAERTVTITADSYDALLGERILPYDFTTTDTTRSAFTHIIGTANGINATGIGIGYIEDGAAAPMSLSNARGADALDKLAEGAGMEWWLSYALDGPTLVIQANIASERGADLFGSVTLVGPDGNFEVEGWRENGRAIAYAQTVVGGESSVLVAFTERERSVAVADGQSNRSDSATQALVIETQRVLRFGHLLAGEHASFAAPTQRREMLAVREELKLAGITGDVAEALFLRRRMPAQVILGRAYPDNNGTWSALEPGNVVHLVSGDAFVGGYDGPAVIVAAQPMEHQRFVDVVLEIA